MAPVTLVPCTGRRNAGTSRKEHASRVRRVFHEAGAERAPRAAMAFSKQGARPAISIDGTKFARPRRARGQVLRSDGATTLKLSREQQQVRLYYRTLLRAWGRQHWWPARSRFEVIVGAYLTQNTAWTNVERALHGLRSAGVWSMPTPAECLIGTAFCQPPRPMSTFAACWNMPWPKALGASRDQKMVSQLGPPPPGILPLLGGSGGGCRALPIPAPRGARPSALP
jgi:hypothetical protein